MKFELEICVDNLASSLDAQNAGASRIELCDNLFEGGTTPGYGIISAVRENLKIGVNVLIRPRAGDFLYTREEYDIMRRDIDMCVEHGVNGIVIGILMPDGNVDVERTARLIEEARPMTTTFHRAFDMCIDPVRGLEDVIAAGADLLLTSGQENSAEIGAGLIQRLVEQAGNRINIMPGGGINESNIEKIARVTKAGQFHLSARKAIDSEMVFRRKGVLMGGINGYNEFTRKVADPEKIKNIIAILNLM